MSRIPRAERQETTSRRTAPQAEAPVLLRAQLGLATPRSRSDRRGPGGLTRREVEILQLVASGMTNRAVARCLWVTSETVKFHLSNVYRKLGVANRAEASEWALRNGVSNREPGLRAM